MRSILVKLCIAALMIGGLAGCGGASIGLNGVNATGGSGGTSAVATVNGKALSAADWQALEPKIDPADISVTLSSTNGKPVVKFKVTDQNGNPIIGLGGQSVSPSAAFGLPSNFNLSFTLAKLVPGTNGSPAKWVNYGVIKPAAVGASLPAASAVTAGTTVSGTPITWVGTYPSADTQGTLVDNGDGTYQYTFLRDITQVQSIVQNIGLSGYEGSPNSGGANGSGVNGVYNVADLDPANLAFDATATHRLGIFIAGSQPGTGVATPRAIATTTPVPLLKNFNIGYDFRPDGGTITNTRDIVAAGSCDQCHDNVKLKRGIGHISVTGTSNLAVSFTGTTANNVLMSNGIPAGTYVGRNDPRLCVTCHTDQTKYGFAVVTGDGTFNYGGTPYFRVAAGVMQDNQAAFTYPRMIHQTHMGNQLVKQGYNLNGHDANCASATVGKDLAAAQCLNGVGYPQDQRNCTKCHDGSATKSDGSVNANQTKDGDNWKNVPSQLACGACHDGINFATGTGSTLADKYADIAAGNPPGTTQSGHLGGVGGLTDNHTCTTCHGSGQLADVQVYHETNFSTLNNPVTSAGVDTVAYSISSVTVDSHGHLNMTFGIKVNGTAVTSLPVNVPVTSLNAGRSNSTGAGATLANTYAQPYPNLIGGPSFYVAYAVPQDGFTPADYNFYASVPLANLLIDTTKGVTPASPAQGYLTNTVSSGAFQAVNGSFTAVLTGDTIGQAISGSCLANASGSYCVTPNPIVIPTSAAMVTGAMIGGFTQTNLPTYPYTAGNLTTGAAASGSGLHVTALLQKMTASKCSQTGISTAQATACKTARRVIVSTANCQNCHEQLGTNQFMDNSILATANGGITTTTADLTHRIGFHNGDRNDPTSCNICHNGNKSDTDYNSGFPADSSTWFHGIHGGSQRTVPFIAGGGSTSALDFSKVLYPGQLKDCSQCHLPNTANFGIAEATGQLSNLLWSYTSAKAITTGGVPPNIFDVIKGVAASGVTATGAGTPLGTLIPKFAASTQQVFSYVISPTGVASANFASDGTLLNSPFASACSSCHDDPVSQSHIKANGGQIQVAHSVVGGTQTAASGVLGSDVALYNQEQCVTCHGQGRTMDAEVIHKQR